VTPSGRFARSPRALWSGTARARSPRTPLTILSPRTLDEALAARAAHPAAVVVAGGTGVLIELNRGAEPEALVDLSRVAGWRAVERDGDVLRLGAGVTYTQVIEQLAGPLPGLALAARTVASPQVRNRGTLAGALVLADPSGDALAALGAAGAQLELRGPGGARRVAADAFITAPGACVLAPDELLTALHVPVADGPVAYAKAGARNAMARAVCGVAVALHEAGRRASVCVVGAAPAAVRPRAAEALVAEAWDALDDAAVARFGQLVAAAVDPLPDVRGSAAYRRHAAGVLARRALRRAWEARS
jgi:CO/xanthine dehydrogenase FAD-binding subunit